MSIIKKPFETNYPRWKNLAHGYVVKILGVQHYRGDHGYYSTVTVEGTRRDPKLQATWSAETFRKDFEPIGRKRRSPKTALERVLEDDGDDDDGK